MMTVTVIDTLSLHDALPICGGHDHGDHQCDEDRDRAGDREGRTPAQVRPDPCGDGDRKSTRLNSSHVAISYAVFCLKTKKLRKTNLGMSRPHCFLKNLKIES